MPRYFANVAVDRPRVAPGELPGAIGVSTDEARLAWSQGIAYQFGRLGAGKSREAVWRLVVGKADLDGRFVLRMGEFIGLAEDADWAEG
jgi:hypothetical protein